MTTTIELPDELRIRAEALAKKTGRTLEEVLAIAVRRGLSYDQWIHDEVAKGLRATEQGDLATSEEVEVLWNHVTMPKADAGDATDQDPAVAALAAQVRSSRQRILGLNQGGITTTTDFDDPLPDEFWLGGV